MRPLQGNEKKNEERKKRNQARKRRIGREIRAQVSKEMRIKMVEDKAPTLLLPPTAASPTADFG